MKFKIKYVEYFVKQLPFKVYIDIFVVRGREYEIPAYPIDEWKWGMKTANS